MKNRPTYNIWNSQSLRRTLTAVLVATAGPAMAWGPDTHESVVSAAGHIYSRNSPVPLTNLMSYIRQGATIGEEEDRALYLQYSVDPVQAIQREMFLLQGVRSDRVDPYFAYRLGALGKKVVEHVAPMRDGSAAIREQYYADVDRAVSRVSLTGSTRNIVEPAAYFGVINREAQSNNGTIAVDYRSGVGFDGLASSNLSKDVSRAVDCVADVWYTIFQSNVEFIDISRSDMRNYMLSSIEFYLKSGNVSEVEDVYVRARQMNLLDAEMKEKVGNYYYDNEYFEEALAVYDELLATNPRIPDVSRRISDYHVSLGKRALNRNDLDAAQVSFQDAVNADQLNEDAQRQLVTTTRAIEKREARYVEQQGHNEAGQRLLLEAEGADQRREYAQAIQYLRDAQDRYSNVTTEFEDLNTDAVIGRRRVQVKLDQMKGGLVNNAQLLSGSGFAYDARLLAEMSGDLSEETLRTILEQNYRSAIDAAADSIDIE